jgi:hypothetical protein
MQEKRSILLEDVEIAGIFAGFHDRSGCNRAGAILFDLRVCSAPRENNG